MVASAPRSPARRIRTISSNRSMSFRRAYFELCGMSIFGGHRVFQGFAGGRGTPGRTIFPRDILASMGPRVERIDHIQIAAPEGCEAAAREFYGGILGMAEIGKAPPPRARGGGGGSVGGPAGSDSGA